MLSIFSFFILLSPVWAQEKDGTDSIPRVQWDVQKDFDSAGNLLRYDSTWSWTSGTRQPAPEHFDSIMQGLAFQKQHFDPVFTFFGDSLLMERFGYTDDFLNELFQSFDHFGQFNGDSLHYPLFGMPEQSIILKDSLYSKDRVEWNRMIKHLKEFQAEHRKLMEKYFGKLPPKADINPQVHQQNHMVPSKKARVSGHTI
jgi:hypothetical protein